MNKTVRKDDKFNPGHPPKVPYHWFYFMLMALGIISALWLHGHPIYTVTILGLLLPCSLANYIPYKYFSRNQRFFTMSLFALAAVGWGVFRFMAREQVDKLLIESICLLALCFSFSPRRRDFGYMLLIAVLLLLYGSLLPRAIYLFIIPIAFILGMLMIYGTRTNGLSRDPDLSVPVFRFSWGKIMLHMLLVIGLWIYFYSLFPKEDTHTSGGFFVTSFRNQNDSFLPPQITVWFKNEKVKRGNSGSIIQNGKPTSMGNQGQKVQSDKNEGMKSSGNGSGLPGKELLFRVKCAVKLYWVAQLYDQYNGDWWTASKAMKNQQKQRRSEYYSRSIPQHFTIEKWVSSVLFSAYRLDYITPDTTQDLALDNNFYHYWFKEKAVLPQLPFSYVAYSEVESTEVIKRRNSTWPEYIPPKNYLQLPEDEISPRIKSLTATITRGITDPYEKAIALRDFLRKNYKYQMISRRTPVGREAVDFFLFELREGHCEYFASALAVMSRVCKIPSRVATGFSPGNYNALTKTFEVHEYHAHAWTQIYIEKYGWLTFDATPPGNIISNTTPMALGRWYDPFGNEWRVNPPELAMRTQDLATPGWISGKKESDGNDEMSVADQLLYDAVMLPEKAGAMMDRLVEMFKKQNEKVFSFKKYFQDLRKNIERFFATMKARMFAMKRWLWAHWLGTTLWFIGIIFFLLSLPRLLLFGIRLHDKYRCRNWLEAAGADCDTAPSRSIHFSYLTVRKNLELHCLPREKNIDLLDYAAIIISRHPQLGNDVLAVFFIYNQLAYSPTLPTSAQARIALNRAAKIHELLNSTAWRNREKTNTTF